MTSTTTPAPCHTTRPHSHNDGPCPGPGGLTRADVRLLVIGAATWVGGLVFFLA